jgi:hypothetical protein
VRPYPKLLDRSPAGVAAWCEKVEKLREEDRAEVEFLRRQAADKGLLYANTARAGNAGTGEDDLMAYALPAGLLTEDGWYVEFQCAFAFAANGNTKRLKLKLGGTTVYDTSAYAPNGKVVTAWVTAVRTGAAAQTVVARVQSNDAALGTGGQTVTVTAATESLAAAVTFKATGEGAATDDVTQQLLTARWYPANRVASV